MRFWLIIRSAASFSLFSCSLLTSGKYLSDSSSRPQITTRSASSWKIGSISSLTASITSASRLAYLPPLPTFTGSAVVVPSSAVVLPITQSAASSRTFCSQPLLTSCSSGLSTRFEVLARFTPLNPIMMRSSAWRLTMALRMRTWKSWNFAHRSSFA